MTLPLSLCLCLSAQMVSEKVGGAEGTKLDEDFKDLERVSKIPSKRAWMSVTVVGQQQTALPPPVFACCGRYLLNSEQADLPAISN